MRLHRKGLSVKQRLRIFERDGGKCQKCGFDLAGALDGVAVFQGGSNYGGIWGSEQSYVKGLGRPPTQPNSTYWTKRYTRVVYGERAPKGIVKWQIHHRKPVIEGGGDEDDNLELVCVHPNCHPKETAKLAARRALRRTYGQNARIPERLK